MYLPQTKALKQACVGLRADVQKSLKQPSVKILSPQRERRDNMPVYRSIDDPGSLFLGMYSAISNNLEGNERSASSPRHQL
jgi:hypothetical protein